MNLIEMFNQIPSGTHRRARHVSETRLPRVTSQYNEPETDFMHSQGFMSIHIFHAKHASDKCIYWMAQQARRKAASGSTFVLAGILVDVKIEEKRVYIKAGQLYTPTKLLELCGINRADSVSIYKKYFRRITKNCANGREVNGIRFDSVETQFGTMYRLKNE